MTRKFVKYNPAFLEESQLVANFVVRHGDLESVIRTIKENVTNSNQHVLVIGPRGSGKTTLMRRVAAEIDRTDDLRGRWYPLLFAEESYKATSAADFWLEALAHLADQTGDEKWMRSYEEIRNESDDKVMGERALWQILDFADSQEKKVLLIVENFNMLFDDLMSEDDAWKIRHTLMNEPRLMLLATATTKFDDIHNPSHALFEMFKMQELKPLDDDECNRVWELVAGKKLTGEQIRPVRILTGGNSRLIAIIAKFGAHRSFQQLLDDLVDLIDDHTDYFKSHLDNMAATERKVYLALAELWSVSSAKEIAGMARLDVNKTSSLLNRLAGRGAVIVEDQEKKNKAYRISEGIYNIYYLMRRHGRPADRVKAVVKFMVVLYGHESATRLLAEEASGLLAEQCRDHYLAYAQVIKEIPDRQRIQAIMKATPKNFLESPYIREALKNLMAEEPKLSITDAKDDAEMKTAHQLIKEAYEHFKAGNYELTLEELNKAISTFAHSKNTSSVLETAKAMVNKGYTLDALNRSEEAIAVYDEVIGRYKDRTEPEIAEQVAMAMFNKGVTFGELNRSEETIRIYDEMIGLYKDRSEPEMAEQVAKAMVNKGCTLGALNRSEEEIKVYDEVIGLYKDRRELEIAKRVAAAMFNKGCTLGALNRSDEAITVYNEVIGLYKDRSELEIAEPVAAAMFNKGVMLGALNHSEEEITVYNEVIGLYKDRSEPEIAEKVAAAMFNKGVMLGALNRSDEAITVYNEVVGRYKDRSEQLIAEMVVRAMVARGATLANVKRFDEAEKAYRSVIERNPNLTDAYIKLIELLLKPLGKPSEALQTAETISSRRAEDSKLLNGIAWIFYKYGSLSLFEQAEVWARKAVALAHADLSAQHTLACILSAIGKGAEALELAKIYLGNADIVEKTINDAIELFVELAASGYAKEALGILEPSPSAKHLEPLVVALKQYIGEDVKTAAEILEVAKDVVKRIEARKKKRKS